MSDILFIWFTVTAVRTEHLQPTGVAVARFAASDVVSLNQQEVHQMDTELLLDRRDEQVGLKREVCLLQEELAESRAEREELESRNRALNDRLCQSVCPSVGLSLHVEAEQREWRRRVREGREREARQSLLIHRLQNKVVEYRERCQRLELQLQDENTQLINTEVTDTTHTTH
ncbi:hypothetical protein JOB18_045841 [Solea senegalensis]|uniref:Rootletin-like coiled-coil domain-containing protein n=3 Tax=Solea senegalensis TaxID=28829 RepID=A0AAV6PH75_SOLSE|nr:hypothetical protein JOB18_045841 [Solea senegalensis]